MSPRSNVLGIAIIFSVLLNLGHTNPLPQATKSVKSEIRNVVPTPAPVADPFHVSGVVTHTRDLKASDLISASPTFDVTALLASLSASLASETATIAERVTSDCPLIAGLPCCGDVVTCWGTGKEVAQPTLAARYTPSAETEDPLAAAPTTLLLAGEPILIIPEETTTITEAGPLIYDNTIFEPSPISTSPPTSTETESGFSTTTSARDQNPKFFTGQIPTPQPVSTTETDPPNTKPYLYSTSLTNITPTPTPPTTFSTQTQTSTPNNPTIQLRSSTPNIICTTTFTKNKPINLNPTSTSYAATTTRYQEVDCEGCSLVIVNRGGRGPVVNFSTTVISPATKTMEQVICASSSSSSSPSYPISTVEVECRRGDAHCG